jgi:GNAT superfamily N-acetyltransferase
MDFFNIVNANIEDIDYFLSLAKREGWNPGVCDAGPFYKTDPAGFFIGKINGRKVGCISAVAYNDTFGFIGFYILEAEYRGKGFGMQLWKHAIQYLGKRVIGLDGVLDQKENYEKSGFKLFCRNSRFKGDLPNLINTSLTELDQVPFQNLLDYDTLIFGHNRSAFLKSWISMPNAFFLAKRENNRLLGYGVIRKCGVGYKIGPLFSSSLDVAKEIYSGLCSKVSGGPIFIDTPELNIQSSDFIETFGLQKCFETVRMYNSPPPRQEIKKIFGITTFELG